VTKALPEFVRREPSPHPGTREATLRRLTLACLAATIPIMTHHIPHALIAMVVMYLVTQEDVAATGLGSFLGLLGATVGLGLALLAWQISIDTPWLRIVFFAAFFFGGMFLKRALTLGGLASAIGLPEGLVMILPAIAPPSPSPGRFPCCGGVSRSAWASTRSSRSLVAGRSTPARARAGHEAGCGRADAAAPLRPRLTAGRIARNALSIAGMMRMAAP
jgi:hypothetical protein